MWTQAKSPARPGHGNNWSKSDCNWPESKYFAQTVPFPPREKTDANGTPDPRCVSYAKRCLVFNCKCNIRITLFLGSQQEKQENLEL